MTKNKKFNFLIIMTDEERYPPGYESEELVTFREKFFKGRNSLRQNALEFHNHHTGATACCPSRGTIFTGQYPSLHGVSQTSGLAKSSFDPGMFWLYPNTVPTLGDYFRTGGYRTFYHGKWHVSDVDLIVPGTRNALLSNDDNGKVKPERVEQYRLADKLDQFGFTGWIGPEPHGALKANSGTVRDPGFANQTAALLNALDEEAGKNPAAPPWLAVCSFVNPHDIVFFGVPWLGLQMKRPPYKKIPDIQPPPTRWEDLETKPRCQWDYVINYGRFYFQQPTIKNYYKLYYYLQWEVDKLIDKVYSTLAKCSNLYENTIVIFTSDHGEMLGAHGGMHQKWYNAYEETLHVPLIFSNPRLFKGTKNSSLLTSHVDLIPTLMGLAGISQEAVREQLEKTHTEARQLVGKDLSGYILSGGGDSKHLNQPIYFMSDDEINEGLNMQPPRQNPKLQREYRAIIEPHHIETVMAYLEFKGKPHLFKYSRYFDNPRFTIGPGNQDPDVVQEWLVPAQYEMYDLTIDPLEKTNMMSGTFQDPEYDGIKKQLKEIMKQQRAEKRLLPRTLNAWTNWTEMDTMPPRRNY